MGTLCHCCTAFVNVSLSVALTGTSLRPLGGKEGQNIAVCLVGRGEELTGRSRWGEEEEEEERPMMVWATEEWRREMRKPRKRRDAGAMVCL